MKHNEIPKKCRDCINMVQDEDTLDYYCRVGARVGLTNCKKYVRVGKKLYMVVTLDKYELPLYVADSVAELSEWSGNTIGAIYSLMSKAKNGKIKRSRFISVDISEV